jgi:hypothetical protein
MRNLLETVSQAFRFLLQHTLLIESTGVFPVPPPLLLIVTALSSTHWATSHSTPSAHPVTVTLAMYMYA